MIVNALKTINTLLNTNRSRQEYFEAVEAIVWLTSNECEPFFDALGWDVEVSRERIDLPLYADLALADFEKHRDFLYKSYVNMARWSFNDDDARVTTTTPYENLKRFAEVALQQTEIVLRENATPEGPCVITGPPKLATVLGHLQSLAEVA